MTLVQPTELLNTGILIPSRQDWRITFTFEDGSSRTIRVSPGRIDEALAVERAKRHAKILDDSVIKSIEARRAEPTLQVAPHGIISKEIK